MAITTSVIVDNYNRLLRYIRNPENQLRIREEGRLRRQDEEALLSSTQICEKMQLEEFRSRLGNIEGKELERIVTEEFMNVDAMETTGCIAESIVYTGPSDVALSINDRIRNYIRGLHQIGGESVEGYAMLGEFLGSKDFFVIKAPRNPDKDSLVHELIVGLHGVNLLRAMIPNFAYIYAGFKCSPPLIDPKTKDVITWCLSNNNAVNYVMYENITPAVSLGSYIKTCSAGEFIIVYMQILYSLLIAHQTIDYTHYDLHDENVLIRKVGNTTFQIPYPVQMANHNAYIITDVVATIIDYGFSHIVYNDHHYGINESIPFSIFPDQSWIFHDAYKLLMFSMLDAIEFGNTEVYNLTKVLFRYFNRTEDPRDIIDFQYKNFRFAFPYNELTKDMKLPDFIAYIRKEFDLRDFIKEEVEDNIPILSCLDACLNRDKILSDIGADKPSSPKTIMEVYDLLGTLAAQGRVSEAQGILDRFPYQEAIQAHDRRYKDTIRQLDVVRGQFKLINLPDYDVEEIMTYDMMIHIRQMYILASKLVDLIHDLALLRTVGIAIASRYDDNKNVEYFRRLDEQYRKDFPEATQEILDVFEKDDAFLDDITKTSKREDWSKDDRLDWYWHIRPLYRKVVGIKI